MSWAGVVARLAVVAMSACVACGDDDDQDDRVDAYVDAYIEEGRTLCTCTRSARDCEETEATRCSYDVFRKHAHKVADLDCRLERMTAELPCFQNCAAEGPSEIAQLNELKACIAKVEAPECPKIDEAVLKAVNEETLERCAPLVVCDDGSKADERGICPLSIQDAGPQPSSVDVCADMVMMTANVFVPRGCAECVCEKDSFIATQCDATCWDLFVCADEFCVGGDAGPAAYDCIPKNCGDYLEGATALASYASTLSSCSTECAGLGR